MERWRRRGRNEGAVNWLFELIQQQLVLFHRAVFKNVSVLEMFHLEVHLAAALELLIASHDLPQTFKLLVFVAFLATLYSHRFGRYPNLATAKNVFTTQVHLIGVLELLITKHDLPQLNFIQTYLLKHPFFSAILKTFHSRWLKYSFWQLTKN